MKTYSIKELRDIAKQQGYTIGCLENSQGEKIQSNNNPSKKLDAHFTTITNRLKSDLFPDGIYYVCLATSINKSKNPDKYPIAKGKLKPEHLEENKPTVTLIEKQENVLTYAAALEYQQKISNLTAEVTQLKFENNLLQSELDELRDDMENGLSDAEPSGAKTFMDETLPSMIPMIDKYFEHEDKKLRLKELELKLKFKQQKPQVRKRPIVAGSQEHLNIIEFYHKNKLQDKLDAQLDKLEDANYELYCQVCDKLGIDYEPEGNEGGEGE